MYNYRLRRLFRGRGCSRGFRSPLQDVTNFFGDFERDRAGVGLLFSYTKTGKQIDDGLGLDLELAGQFVDADL